jgi:hypothetical protein
MTNTKPMNVWDWDVRVRDRNLANAVIDEKDLQKYHAGLEDLAEQAEPMGIPQPALGGRDS